MCCEPCMDAYSARAHIHKCPECDANELCHDAECTFVSVNPDWHPRGEPRLCDEHQAAVRQARTIRRLRALADGYRARLASLPTGDATDNAMATMHETEHAGHASLPDAALWGHGRDAGIKAERARIVARLRELAAESDMHAFRADLRWAAEFIESEEP